MDTVWWIWGSCFSDLTCLVWSRNQSCLFEVPGMAPCSKFLSSLSRMRSCPPKVMMAHLQVVCVCLTGVCRLQRVRSSALTSRVAGKPLFAAQWFTHPSACRSKKGQKDLQDSEEKPRCFPNPFGVDKLRIRLKVRVRTALLQYPAAITHTAILQPSSVPHRHQWTPAAVPCHA